MWVSCAALTSAVCGGREGRAPTNRGDRDGAESSSCSKRSVFGRVWVVVLWGDGRSGLLVGRGGWRVVGWCGRMSVEVTMGNGTSDKEMLVMAIAKAVVCVLLAGVVGYSIIAGVSVNAELLKVILLLLASYFGFSAKMYYASSGRGRGGRKGG